MNSLNKFTSFQEKLIALPLAKRLVALQDPVVFIKACCYTRDEVHPKEPVRLAPMTPGMPDYKPYLEPIIRIWQENPMLIIDKARRLWISYLMLCLHLHMAFTNTDRRIGIMSKKFDDACAHLENMKRIYESIPEEIYPAACRPALRTKEGMMYFDEIGSIVHALASGPDQARQYGFSAILWDEMDFTDDQEATYAALSPTLQNGGRLTIPTTHRMQDSGLESFYRRLLEDKI